MKELDFDELDKAVSSLMGNVKEKDVDTPSKTLDVSTTLAPDETPAYSKLEQAAEKIDGETTDVGEQTVSLSDEKPALGPSLPSTPTPAPASRGGRFMDVVHPSSDMRTKSPVSRVGTTIAAPVPAPVTISTPAEEGTISTVELVESSDTSTTAGNLPVTSEPDMDSDDDDEEVKVTSTGDEPITSPFLADAKVEKRPLGGASAPTPEVPLITESTPEPTDEEPEPAPAKGDESSRMDAMSAPVSNLDEITEHVPEEYKDELLAVEKTPMSELTADSPVPQLETASIPKQYQEKPNTGDSTSGAIYDTSSYHKPLSQQSKKKPVLLWVGSLIAIIACGIAVGFAVYFFGLM